MSEYGGEAYVSSQVAIITLLSIFSATATFLVALRCYSRTKLSHAFGWDDGLIVVAMIFGFLSVGFVATGVRYGLGRPETTILGPAVALPEIVQMNIAYQIAGNTGDVFMRLSIQVLLMRIGIGKRLKHICIGLMVFGPMTIIVLDALILAQCIPLDKAWNPMVSGHCISEQILVDYSYFSAAVSILIDFFCSISPAYVLWNVKMPVRRRVLICILMSLGLSATVCLMLRNVYVAQLQDGADPTDDYAVVIVTILEQFLGIICACIPVVFRPIIEFSQTISSSLMSRSLISKSGGSTDKSGASDDSEEHFARQSVAPNQITQSTDLTVEKRDADSDDDLRSNSVSHLYNSTLR